MVLVKIKRSEVLELKDDVAVHKFKRLKLRAKGEERRGKSDHESSLISSARLSRSLVCNEQSKTESPEAAVLNLQSDWSEP